MREVWHDGHFTCDNTRCDYEADRDYGGALNVARVTFGDSVTLDHEFTSSYTGDAELVLARRSAGARPVVGTAPIAYTSEQVRMTAGGGSTCIAPAVTPTGTTNESSTPKSVASPAIHSTSQFTGMTTVCCRK